MRGREREDLRPSVCVTSRRGGARRTREEETRANLITGAMLLPKEPREIQMDADTGIFCALGVVKV